METKMHRLSFLMNFPRSISINFLKVSTSFSKNLKSSKGSFDELLQELLGNFPQNLYTAFLRTFSKLFSSSFTFSLEHFKDLPSPSCCASFFGSKTHIFVTNAYKNVAMKRVSEKRKSNQQFSVAFLGPVCLNVRCHFVRACETFSKSSHQETFLLETFPFSLLAFSPSLFFNVFE